MNCTTFADSLIFACYPTCEAVIHSLLLNHIILVSVRAASQVIKRRKLHVLTHRFQVTWTTITKSIFFSFWMHFMAMMTSSCTQCTASFWSSCSACLTSKPRLDDIFSSIEQITADCILSFRAFAICYIFAITKRIMNHSFVLKRMAFMTSNCTALTDVNLALFATVHDLINRLKTWQIKRTF